MRNAIRWSPAEEWRSLVRFGHVRCISTPLLIGPGVSRSRSGFMPLGKAGLSPCEKAGHIPNGDGKSPRKAIA